MELKKEYIKKIEKVTKPRCTACCECPMGVVGCDGPRIPHGHGSAKNCPECGVPYAYVHPHSNVCSKGTPISEDVRHDEHNLYRQLKWVREGR